MCVLGGGGFFVVSTITYPRMGSVFFFFWVFLLFSKNFAINFFFVWGNALDQNNGGFENVFCMF